LRFPQRRATGARFNMQALKHVGNGTHGRQFHGFSGAELVPPARHSPGAGAKIIDHELPAM